MLHKCRALRAVYVSMTQAIDMYTIGLDTDQGTLRGLTVDELSDADRLPEGAYV